jgi:hypothetical protein
MCLQSTYRVVFGALMLALLIVGSGLAATQRTLVAPTISDFTPKSGGPGTRVVITGTGLAAGGVAFFGVSAGSVVVNADGTSITATVPTLTAPETPQPAPITVTTSGGTVNSAAAFTYSHTPGPSTPSANAPTTAKPVVVLPTTVWTAALSAGQEIPGQVAKTVRAHGLFKATLRGKRLKWTLTYSRLTGPATAAHIHMAATGLSGPIVVQLCSLCRSGMSGSTMLTPALLSALKNHLLYVNVHTRKNPNGEIRGQLASGQL